MLEEYTIILKYKISIKKYGVIQYYAVSPLLILYHMKYN